MSDHDRAPYAFRMAMAADRAAVVALLAGQGLPSEDIGEDLDRFLLAYRADDLVGVAGVERHGDAGLLRSVCVGAEERGHDLGRTLCRRIEAYARDAGMRHLFLLTSTATEYFARLGYAAYARDAAPEAVRQSAQFRALCPASATCMTKALGDDGAGEDRA